MRIEGITDIGGAAQAGKKEVTPASEFLTLLVAQLEQQNPLDPQSGAEFVAQLAQFSAVEQGAETNRLLGELQLAQAASSHTALASFVGKEASVSAEGFELRKAGGGVPPLSVELPGPAAEVSVNVLDAAGNVVRSIELGPQAGPTLEVPWDGTNAQGMPLDDGMYRVEVIARDADDQTMDARALMRGVIDGIDFSAGGARLRIGGAAFAPGDVSSIG